MQKRNTLKLLILGAVFFALPVFGQVWNNPACGPTGCNAPEPINASTTDQIKLGGLSLNTLLVNFGSQFGTNSAYTMTVNARAQFNGGLSAATGATFLGTVGIFTASPDVNYKLDVAGNIITGSVANGSSIAIRSYSDGRNWWIRDDAGVNRLRFSRGSTDAVFWDILKTVGSDAIGGQIWYSGGSERIRLDSAGNVGIGTAVPGAKLDVVGTVRVGSRIETRSGNLEVSGGGWGVDVLLDTDGGSADTFRVLDTGVEKFRIDGNTGNVGIGTTNTSAAKLTVEGTVKITGGTPGAGKVLTSSDATGLAVWGNVGGTGTVTQLNQGTGITLSPSPIVGSGTIAADSTYLQRRVSGCGVGNAIQSVGADGTPTCVSTGGSGTIGGSGTAGRIPRFSTNGSTLGDSSISDDGTNATLIGRLNDAQNAGYYLDPNSSSLLYLLGVDGLNIFGSAGMSGNLGVGTFSPGNKLTVLSATSLDGIFATNGTRWMRLMPGTVGAGSFNGIVQANDNAIIYSGGTQGTGNFVIAPWASGTSGIRMDASGNVGIGTAVPGAKLQVDGSVLLGSGASSVTSGFNGEFGNPLIGGSGGFRFNKNSATAGDKVFQSVHSNSGISFYQEVLSLVDSRFVFSGGNVGIGTTNPTAKLHVGGVAGTDGIRFPDGTLQTSSAGAGSSLWAPSGTNISNTNSGNVGIGTTNPGAKLVVSGGQIRIDNTSFSRIEHAVSGTNQWTVGLRDTNDYYIFRETGTTNVLIPSGNVGIGTTPSSFGLAVQKDDGSGFAALFRANNGVGGVKIGTASSIGTIQAMTSVGANGNLALNPNGGNVGIGTVSPGAKLEVVGSLTARTQAGGPKLELQTTEGVVNNYNTTNSLNSAGTLGGWVLRASNFSFYGLAAPTKAVHFYDEVIYAGALHTAGAVSLFLGTNYATHQTITATGNVGIGTTNPATRLSLVSSDADFTTGFSLGRTATGNGKYVITNSDDNIFRIAFASNAGTAHADYINRMVINSSGNVGIGMTNPTQKLDVNGNVNASGYCIAGANCISAWPSGGGVTPALDAVTTAGNTTANNIFVGGVSGVSLLIAPGNSQMNGSLTVNGTGVFGSSVGIGTANLGSYRLDVLGIPSVDTVARLKSQTANSYLTFENTGGNNSISATGNTLYVGGGGIAGALAFRNGWTTNMTLDTAGNLGIGGAPAAGYKLDVVGDIRGTRLCIGTDCRQVWPSGGGVGGSGIDGYVAKFTPNGTTLGSSIIRDNGTNVGIGVAPHVTHRLDVSGSVQATAYFYVSDRNLKTNIRPIESALEKILKLAGVIFQWKGDESGKDNIGVIAQDVEKVFPEIVHTDDNGLKSVEYGNLVAPLIEAIKEQQKQIDALKAEIKLLKNN